MRLKDELFVSYLNSPSLNMWSDIVFFVRYQDNACLVKCVWKNFLSPTFWMSLRRMGLNSSLNVWWNSRDFPDRSGCKCLVEFTSGAIWSYTFASWEISDYWSISFLVIRLFIFSLSSIVSPGRLYLSENLFSLLSNLLMHYLVLSRYSNLNLCITFV